MSESRKREKTNLCYIINRFPTEGIRITRKIKFF